MVRLQTKCYPRPLFDYTEFELGDIVPLQKFVDWVIIEVSDEVFEFLQQIAIVEVPMFGEKVYKVNKLEFRVIDEK